MFKNKILFLINLTASLVLYNNDLQEIEEVVSSFFSAYSNSFLYIIDNSSKSHNHIFKDYENVMYIYNNKNLGFGKAHNIGIKKAIALNSNYHIILNPDICIEKDTINKLIHFMDKNQEIGLTMPKVLYPSGKLQFLCKLIPTPKNLIIRRFSIIKNWIKNNDKVYELRFFKYNKNIEIPYVSGCFMFARTSILKKVNGFDERFFLYFEDLDLTRRIGQISKTVFFSEAIIYHKYRKESYQNNMAFIYHILSSIKYFNKWGWLIDKERTKINKKILLQFSEHKK